jgi:hypothetical protein
MNNAQSNEAEGTRARAPYRAPVVVVVMHHSETRTAGGMGADKPVSDANSLS